MIQVSTFNINYCRFQKYIRVEGGGGGGALCSFNNPFTLRVNYGDM